MTDPASRVRVWWPEHVSTMLAWLRGEQTSQADIQAWVDRCGSRMGPGFSEAVAGLLAETDDEARRQACRLIAAMTHADGPAGAAAALARKAPPAKK